MKIENDIIYFSSGRELHVNGGIVGISPILDVFEGYDGIIQSALYMESQDLTFYELTELADYMVNKWKELKENLLKNDINNKLR